MKKEKLLIILFMLVLSSAVAQNKGKKCDLEKVAIAEKSIEKLNTKVIEDFLLTFGSTCSSNAEYSQWSNEVLYKVLEKNPSLFFSVLQKNKSIDVNTLVKELQEPLLDYNFQSIYDKVNVATAPASLKARFLNALEKAAVNDGQKVKKH